MLLNRRALKTTYMSICLSTINVVKYPPTRYEKTAEVFKAYSSYRELQVINWTHQTLLTNIFTGKYKELCAYKSHLDVSGSLYASAIKIHIIFTIDCRDAQKQKLRLDILVRIRLPDRARCTGSGTGEETSLLGTY